MHTFVCVSVCVCVCVREREREREKEKVCVREKECVQKSVGEEEVFRHRRERLVRIRKSECEEDRRNE